MSWVGLDLPRIFTWGQNLTFGPCLTSGHLGEMSNFAFGINYDIMCPHMKDYISVWISIV